MFRAKRGEVGPPLLMRYGATKGHFCLWKSSEMRCGIEPKASKSVVEITALKGLPQIVRCGIAMERRAAVSADELEICTGRRDLRCRSVCDAKFLKHPEEWIREGLARVVRIGDVDAVPSVTILRPCAAVD